MIVGNVLPETIEITNRTPIARNKFVRNLIISLGTLVTITLSLFIGREILRFHRVSKIHNNHNPDDMPVAFNIYEDVIESQ